MGHRGGLSGGGIRATALTSESERQSAADSVCGSTARTPAWHEEKRENLRRRNPGDSTGGGLSTRSGEGVPSQPSFPIDDRGLH